VIVNNLNIEYAPVFPTEADPPSFVDTDAVLTQPARFQSFETIAGWHCQVPQNSCTVKVEQLPPRGPLKGPESRHGQIVKQVLGCLVFEGLDHGPSMLRIASYVKRNIDGV
jgi:hypothetical protein